MVIKTYELILYCGSMAAQKIPEGIQQKVKTVEISRNPENPRIIFDLTGMAELKESIRQVGILVPLIVFRGRVVWRVQET